MHNLQQTKGTSTVSSAIFTNFSHTAECVVDSSKVTLLDWAWISWDMANLETPGLVSVSGSFVFWLGACSSFLIPSMKVWSQLLPRGSVAVSTLLSFAFFFTGGIGEVTTGIWVMLLLTTWVAMCFFRLVVPQLGLCARTSPHCWHLVDNFEIMSCHIIFITWQTQPVVHLR